MLTPHNYGRFIELIGVTFRKHIPKECREHHVPGLSEKSRSLYEAYKKQYSHDLFGNTTIEAGTRLFDRMTEEKRKIWEEVIKSTELTHNSHNAWQAIKNLANDPTTSTPP